MATPRKFSEKIAMHNQKQAEETAAFEAIMKEVNSATKPVHPKQHNPLSPSLGAYRGGSLPNVNQIGANQSIDLQTALQHLEDIKQGRPNIHHRVDRQRQIGPHRQRPFPVDKRVDSSPYGPAAYLPLPPDTSWRRMYRYLNGVSLSRTHSDSALHTSAMGPSPGNPSNVGDLYGPPSNTPPTHKRIMEMVGEDSPEMKGYWGDPKKMGLSRPKSCEVPNINIYPSQDQDVMGPHIPIANNTGSLPDLTVIQFPSPLITPLDAEDGSGYGGSGSPSSLSPTSPIHMTMPPPSSQQSPAQRRRHVHAVPSPLVLNNSGQMHPLSPSVDPSSLPLDPRIAQQYMVHMHQQRHRSPYHHPHHHPLGVNSTLTKNGPSDGATLGGMGSSGGPTAILTGQGQVGSPPTGLSQQGLPQVHVTACGASRQQQQSMMQYRNSVTEGCQSPTSPHSSTQSYSPIQSPVLPPTVNNNNNNNNNSPFTEAYYAQQQQQQQTNALQHQFEQFKMDNPPTTTMESQMVMNSDVMSSSQMMGQSPSLPFSQVVMQGLGSSIDFQQQSSQQQQQQQPQQQPPPNFFHSPDLLSSIDSMIPGQFPQIMPTSVNNKIPDIVLTGADDPFGRTPLDFAKELGNAITGMPDGFDADFLSNDEAFKADLAPIDFDGLQILTDPSMVADPATEDTFKLDRL